MMKKFAVILWFCSATLTAQKIERSKRELTSSGRTEKAARTTGAAQFDHANPFLDLFANVFGAVFKYGLIGDYNSENHLHNRLAPYPFADAVAGNYTADSLAARTFRVDLENQIMYGNNDLFGNHLKAKIRPFEYFYVQADYRELFERRLDNTNDRLALLHFNVCYDRLRLEKWNLGWNLGASYVGTEVRRFGFCYGLSADYFPGKRISFSAAGKWSAIGSQPVNALEVSGRYHKRQFFGTLGFQRLKIASPTYNFIAAGGGLYL